MQPATASMYCVYGPVRMDGWIKEAEQPGQGRALQSVMRPRQAGLFLVIFAHGAKSACDPDFLSLVNVFLIHIQQQGRLSKAGSVVRVHWNSKKDVK